VPAGADDAPSSQLPSWPVPQGGYERVMKPDRRAKRRRPLRHREIALLRIMLLLEAAFSIVVLAAGQPATSLWHAAAIGVATHVVVFVATCSRYRLLQLVGLRPPADPHGPGG
jgi:hypothetical protein